MEHILQEQGPAGQVFPGCLRGAAAFAQINSNLFKLVTACYSMLQPPLSPAGGARHGAIRDTRASTIQNLMEKATKALQKCPTLVCVILNG